MIQDIAPHRFDNTYRPERHALPGDVALCFAGEDILMCVTPAEDALPEASLPSLSTLAALFPDSGSALPEVLSEGQFLFEIDETAVYGFSCERVQAALPAGTSFPEDTERFRLIPPRQLRSAFRCERHEVFTAYTALHLFRWYKENRYCGSCGAQTHPAKEERALDCPACGRRIYPRIAPAVIVGVTKGDEILLTRYANRYHSYHALVAGYNEIGETLEDTVRREVMEEVGLKVKNIRYYKSQPWAIAGDLLSGYFCDVDGDTTIRMDESELKEAVWVRREDVDGQPDDFSLTNEMMMLFKAGREPR
ncbi:MAG: NAD(+) diphosphatase [Lachnospiraceae bacterium]|nr:NAD(+) diphosphatase [Lachnospiraceae bacterium]